MPTIHDFGSFKISIYFGDHNPPHFHVSAPEFAAKVRMDDLTITDGSLPPAIRRRVRRWAKSNQDVLQTAWSTYTGE